MCVRSEGGASGLRVWHERGVLTRARAWSVGARGENRVQHGRQSVHPSASSTVPFTFHQDACGSVLGGRLLLQALLVIARTAARLSVRWLVNGVIAITQPAA